MASKKPPIGIITHHLWLEERVDNLMKAIDRYKEAGVPIPKEWQSELKEHLEKLSK
jgi:hypothetical protein